MRRELQVVDVRDPHVAGPPDTAPESRSRIYVVFTDRRGTAAALTSAAALAAQLNFRLDVVVSQVVPYPLPAANPPVPVTFTVDQIRELAHSTSAEPDIHVYLCRERLPTLLEVLPPHSVVAIGMKRTWLPTKVKRLARALEREGHVVIVAPYG